MAGTLKTVSPIDGSVCVERTLAGEGEIAAALMRAKSAQRGWAALSLADRAQQLTRLVDAFVARKAEIAGEITRQMGRPIRYTPSEVGGFEERARYMIGIAAEALAPLALDGDGAGKVRRWIAREPRGLVLVIAPWNYPYLTAVNAVVPALMAGNAVILKHAAQTMLVGDRFQQAFDRAGLPAGLFQSLVLTHEQAARVIAGRGVDQVNFTGSVGGGKAIEQAAAGAFIGVGLELGGKDPAYVRADADLPFAIENLVDGAFFNSGQSCCGVERIYVHRDVYRRFVDGFVELTHAYVLGDPLDPATTLGPMIKAEAATFARGQVADAVQAGARALVDPRRFPRDQVGSTYMAPQVVVDVDHRMSLMRDESFAPTVGVMAVASDDEAVRLMNDSAYGLTASIWTADPDAAARIGDSVDTGTVFMNRCDYLDPALAWTGVKDTGRGATLSRFGYEALTRPKSFYLRQQS